MKKIFYTLTVLYLFSLTIVPCYSNSLSANNLIKKGEPIAKKGVITLGSNRASGEMLLRFTAEKAGEITIAILDEAGLVILQQNNLVTKSNNELILKDATRLTEGKYTVRLISNNKTYTTRFIIWK